MKKVVSYAISLLAVLSSSGHAEQNVTQARSLQAGVAVVDISPRTLPAKQNGGFLQRVTNRVADPLYARALVLSDGRETIAIAIVDSCMFPRTLCDEIKRHTRKQTGIPQRRILISATHTHSAPAAMMCLGCERDEAYVKYVPGRVAEAIDKAHKNLQPAKLGWSVVNGSDLTHCRRWITRSDRMGLDPFGKRTVRAMMHPGYQNPNYTSPAGPVDPWLSVMSVVSAKDDRPICVMANLSMHYFGGGGFSADYFGEVARLLKDRIGKESGKSTEGFVGMMTQGTSGDLHWMDYSKPRRNVSRRQYARRVADRIMKARKGIRYRPDLSIRMAEKRVVIGRRLPSSERLAWARAINQRRGKRPARNRVEVYAHHAQWIHENPKEEVVLQAVRIGDLGLTAMPNEVFGITGLKLKRQSPMATTINLELANGGAGYIPPPEQHRLGGYTTWPARSAGLSEQAEPLIVDTVLGLLEKVSGKKRRPLVDSVPSYSKAVIGKKPIAYWRLDDMRSTRAKDAVGKNHAQYKGGIALFLSGPKGMGFKSPGYGNRSIYLAGGHIDGGLDQPLDRFSVSMWFLNALPSEARSVTGTLLSNGGATLQIAGKTAGDRAGNLVLRIGKKVCFGTTRVMTGYWHDVTMTHDNGRIRVYLDGAAKPEIDIEVQPLKPSKRLLIGSDGGSSSTFDGKVDEVAVFDHVLTGQDVANLYSIAGVASPPRPQPVIVLGPKPKDAKSRKQYAEMVLKSKPVAYWRMDDGSRRSAKSSVGGYEGMYEKGAVPYKPGSGVPNFTGGRVKGRVPKLGNTYSVEMWIRNTLPHDARPVTAYVFSRGVDQARGAPGDSLGIGGTHVGAGRLIVFNGNLRNEVMVGMTPIKPGSWSHVVLIRQGRKVTVYLNAYPKPEISGELAITYPAHCEDILIGGRNDNFANLQGSLEEVAIYDRALTYQEVKSHFTASGVKPVVNAGESSSARTDKSKKGNRPLPTDAEQALKTIHVPKGFKVELIAAEPRVKDPVAIDWGADGKLWVAEMADYPSGTDGKGKPGGRIRLLEDSNGDGRYDQATLFTEGLKFPNGVLAWGRGVLVTAAPDIVYLEDTSGDGKADVRRVLYSGFLQGNQQLRVNGLRPGLDNWIYCASGSHHAGYGKGSQILSKVTGKRHLIGSRDFRIHPDTGAIDPQSGPSQFGRSRNDWGNWFGVQNSHPLWHYVLDDQNIRRNPHFAPPDPKKLVVTPANPRVYPASTAQKRFHSFNHSGRFTSACSPMIYRDSILFDRGKEQHAFTCEPFHNLVQHNLIRDEGVSFASRRDPAEKKMDFFASEDRWCRPVMVRTGPDGALWVVDMYRYVIEHPQWLPKSGREELRAWFRSGSDRGRIYRVVRTDRPLRTITPLAKLSAEALVAKLESPNGWVRDTAQRLLVRGKHRSAAKALQRLTAKSKQPLARLHSLWTLHGLGVLSAKTLEGSLGDDHPGVRRNALRIASQVKVNPTKFARLAEDSDAKVRLQLASTLGAYSDETSGAVLAELFVNSKGDRYISAAVMSSLNQKNVSIVLANALKSIGNGDQSIAFALVTQAIAMGDKETVGRVVQLVSSPMRNRSEKSGYESMARALDSLAKRQWTVNSLPEATRQYVSKMIQKARQAAANPTVAEDIRAASIQLLGREDALRESDFKLMQRLLVPQSPLVLQDAIVAYLAGRSETSIAEILVAGWASHSPKLRRQILNVLASRKTWAESIRRLLEAGTIRVSELSAAVRQRLLARHKNSPQWRKALAVKTSANRASVVRQYQSALKLKGDASKGEILFSRLCISCHKLKDKGFDIGPQLASITDKSRESLLSSILDPNATVDPRYLMYIVITKDNRILSGRLKSETGSSITLLAIGGKSHTILRRDVKKLEAFNRSLMPEGLEQGLKPTDMADLLRYVRQTFR